MPIPPLLRKALATLRSTWSAVGSAARRLPPLPGGSRLWVTLLSLGFVLAALRGNAEQLLAQRIDPQGWLWLAIGVGVSLLSLVLNGVAWGVGLRWLGCRPRWGAVLRAYLCTNLLKYLPGGVWHLAARVRLLRASPADGSAGSEAVVEEPLGTARALAATLLDPLVAACAALALVPAGGWQDGLALLTPLPLLLLVPRWFQPLLLRLERRRARQLRLVDGSISDTAELSLPGYPLLPLIAQLVFVLARFAGFACCVLAFDQQLSLGWPSWLAGFALAWTVGLVVPGAPGGLGVFEAVLLLRLGTQLAEPPLLAVALSYRLVVTLADLLAAGSARLDQQLARPAAAPSQLI